MSLASDPTVGKGPSAPPEPSVEQIAEWLGLLVPPGFTFEIRAPKCRLRPTSRTCSGDSPLAAAKIAKGFSGKAKAVYFSLNAVRPDLPDGEAASDKDVVRRLLLLVDFDPQRPKDTNSTNSEKNEAAAVANEVVDHLRSWGFPDPTVVDSGNGYHLLYRIDLPADDGGLVEMFLYTLHHQFSTSEVLVDTGVFNPSRITKLPGTLTKKGPHSQERPHRFSRLLHAPDEFQPVPAELLRAYIDTAAPYIPPKQAKKEADQAEAYVPPPRTEVTGDDAELLEMARRANNGAEFCRLYDQGEFGPSQSHSQADLALCNMLAFWCGPDPNRIDRLFRGSALLRSKWDKVHYRDGSTYGAKTVTKSLENRKDFYTPGYKRGPQPFRVPGDPPGGEPPEGDNRDKRDKKPPAKPDVVIDHEMHRVLDETLACLPLDPGLFCRGDVLVRIDRLADETSKVHGVEFRKATGSVRAMMIGEAGLSCRLTAIANFWKWFKDRSGEDITRQVSPPSWLARAVMERGVYPGVRPLRGVAEVPFPRPDGSLVTIAGYDPATGVFYAPTVTVDEIPDRPTRADAWRAAETLLALVDQFPFATDGDRAVWLAGLLTIMARPAIDGPVPGFAYIGNRAGAGKGKLIDTKAVIATGRPVPTTSYPHDEDETRKLKTALALAATPIVHLDNLDEGRSYGGGVLDSALTSLEVNERILGQSKSTGGIELRCCWFLSGNNLAPAKDAGRRWLVCNLATALERPEERDDLKVPDLLAHVRERRGELVRAALVILRAHAVAGRPSNWKSKLGSFEQWDEIVRGAVWFATGWDCNETRRQAAEESPERLDHLALMKAWAKHPYGGPDGRGLTAEEACRLANGDSRVPGSGSEMAEELAEALARYGRDGKVPPARQVGHTIRRMAGKNVEGLMFVRRGHHRNVVLWGVAKAYPDPQEPPKSSKPDHSDCEFGENCEFASQSSRKSSGPYEDVTSCGGGGSASDNGAEQTRATHQTHTSECGSGGSGGSSGNHPGARFTSHTDVNTSGERGNATGYECGTDPQDPPDPHPNCGGCFRMECRNCNP